MGNIYTKCFNDGQSGGGVLRRRWLHNNSEGLLLHYMSAETSERCVISLSAAVIRGLL